MSLPRLINTGSQARYCHISDIVSLLRWKSGEGYLEIYKISFRYNKLTYEVCSVCSQLRGHFHTFFRKAYTNRFLSVHRKRYVLLLVKAFVLFNF